MISQQLQRYRRNNRLEEIFDIWNFDDVVHQSVQLAINLINDGDYRATSSLDLLQVAHRFIVNIGSREQENRWGIFIDKGDWTVLHFRRWIAFGMNVADFF